MFWLAFWTLSQRPDGSEYNSENSVCEISGAYLVCPSTFSTVKYIANSFFVTRQSPSLQYRQFGGSLFLPFALKLLWQAVTLNDKLLSTRLLYTISSICWLAPKLPLFQTENSC